MNLVLILLGVVVAFVLVIVLLGRFTLGRADKSVSGHFDAVDFIMGTGLAPPSWSARYHRALARLTRKDVDSERLDKFKSRAAKKLTGRLRRLERQIARSSIFDDQAASTIRFVVKSWSEGAFEDIAPPGSM